MVANLRCNELKEEALNLIATQITRLRDSCLKGYQQNFKQACSEILGQATTHFDNYAVSYDRTVYEKIKGELEEAIMQKLYICFDTQLKMLIQQNFEKFNKEVRSLSKKDEVNEEFAV